MEMARITVIYAEVFGWGQPNVLGVRISGGWGEILVLGRNFSIGRSPEIWGNFPKNCI